MTPDQERAEILRQHQANLETTVSNPTKESTQWGPAGTGAQMTCGNTNPCAMFSPYASSPILGRCSLGWDTRRQYQCNQWTPGTSDHDADDTRARTS